MTQGKQSSSGEITQKTAYILLSAVRRFMNLHQYDVNDEHLSDLKPMADHADEFGRWESCIESIIDAVAYHEQRKNNN